MAQHILFISTEYLKQNTPIDNNVDSDVLLPFIIQAQKIHIEPILGTDLYKKLQDDIVGSPGISGDYQTLLDEYIQNTLAYWTLYDALPFLNYKLTNKSVMKKESDNSVASDLAEIKYLHANVRDNVEYLSQRISNYLCENSELYPEYTSNNDGDDIRPNGGSYFSGIYLG